MTEQVYGNPPFLMKCLQDLEWQKYLSQYDFGTVPPGRIVLHHTWSPSIEAWKGKTSMEGMQRYYAGLGWSAAPHLYIAPDGIWLATPMCDVGIHAGVGNSGVWDGKWSYSLGIEMVGDYDKQKPSGRIWELTKLVIGTLSIRLGIEPEKLIFFHRDFSTKTCPGKAVEKAWVLSEIEHWLQQQQQQIAVAPEFMASWQASGGVWKPEQLTPGYPVANPEIGYDGNWQQRFERSIAVVVDGKVHWRLLSEITTKMNNLT